MPKLQTGCTLTATDGMVVKTARTSDEGGDRAERDARVHPRQPSARLPGLRQGRRVPAAGSDVPLRPRQHADELREADVREADPDLADDRARPRALHPLLPLHALQLGRERGRAARRRQPRRGVGHHDVRGLPYTGAFTGNVTELCPVGALLPTQYRFDARPWDIAEVPTVCGLCPVGCNISATVREGNVKRIQSRNHPEIDEGWICDKGRFAFTHVRAEDRLTAPRRGNHEISWDDALDEAEKLLRGARGRIVTALSGSETVEQAYALGKLLRGGLDSHEAMLPEEVSGALDGYRAAALRDSRRRRGRRPRRRAGRRARAGRRSLDQGRAAERREDPRLGRRRRRGRARRARSGRAPAVTAARPSRSSPRSSGSPTARAVAPSTSPRTPNGRGVADAWAASSDDEGAEPESIGVLVISGDDAAANPDVRALAAQADATIVISMFELPEGLIPDLLLPGTSYLERDGTLVNLEGRLQRLRRTVDAAVPRRARVDLGARGALRRRRRSVSPPACSARCRRRSTAASASARSASRRRCAATPTPRRASTCPCSPSAKSTPGQGEVRLVAYKPLFSGAAVERVTELQFQRPQAEVELSAEDAGWRGIADRRPRHASGRTAARSRSRRASTASSRKGIARVALEHANGLGGIVELSRATETADA